MQCLVLNLLCSVTDRSISFLAAIAVPSVRANNFTLRLAHLVAWRHVTTATAKRDLDLA